MQKFVVLTNGLFQEFVESCGAFMGHDWSVPELESVRLVPPESIRIMEGDWGERALQGILPIMQMDG